MLFAMLRGISLRRDMGLGHFLNSRHENLIWGIFLLLNDRESLFWCQTPMFSG